MTDILTNNNGILDTVEDDYTPPLTSQESVDNYSGVVNTKIFNSIVKIFVVKCSPNYSRPWQMKSQSHSSSTGFMISNKRILCTAHGVRYARSIRVRKHGQSKKWEAKIEIIAHDCDLAILRIPEPKKQSNHKKKKMNKLKVISDITSNSINPSLATNINSTSDDIIQDSIDFWLDYSPLTFENTKPKLQETVVVVGYPIGGDNICVTKGVISRLGMITYSHSSTSLFCIQIDAAINHGNGGGPTIINNKVVGVALYSAHRQNIGYCIPIKVVTHLFTDIQKNGKYTGIPRVGFAYQNTESPAMKTLKQMPTNCSGGILVKWTVPLTDFYKKLKTGDIILQMDDIEIGEDGTIAYENIMDGVGRIGFNYIVKNKFVDDCICIKILRNGEIFDVDIKLNQFPYLTPVIHYSLDVKWFIFGGLVFLPLSRAYLSSEFGSKWSSKCSSKFKFLYLYGYKEQLSDEAVILSRVLAGDVNVGYHKFRNQLLLKCNEQEIHNLQELCDICDQCSDDSFLKFEFERKIVIIMNKRRAFNGMSKLLESHKIKNDRSENLINSAVDICGVKDEIVGNDESKESGLLANGQIIRMLECSKCKEKNPNIFSFCPFCGTKSVTVEIEVQ